MLQEKERQYAGCTMSKSQYIRNLPAGIPLFHSPFWLDAVCGNNWDVALLEKDHRIEASLPYFFSENQKKMQLPMPPLTQFLGPWIAPNELKTTSRIRREIELLAALEELLPAAVSYHQNWQYKMTNWLPFYWKDYQQTTRYTYVIRDTKDIQKVWTEFRENVRREIRKAERNIEIQKGNDIEEMYRLIGMTFRKQGKSTPYDYALLERTVQAAINHHAGEILFAIDGSNRKVAVSFFAWDDESVYYIAGGLDHEANAGGAMSLLIWSGIKYAAQHGKIFDFEGSMLPGVEKFFRGFGGEQQPFFQVSKTTMTRMMMMKNGLKNIISALKGSPGLSVHE